MTTRTVKMYGKAYGENVSLQASFNNVEIVNGTISSVNTDPNLSVDWNDLDVIVTFSLDSSVTGNVPFSATVTGGTFVFHTFHADYCGDIYEKNVADPSADDILVTPSAENISDISFGAESPDTGHNNIVINGENKTRDLDAYPGAVGTWNWAIEDGQTMTMDIEVSAVE